MKVNVYDDLPDVELVNCGGGRGERRSSVSRLAIAKEVLFLFGHHWNERIGADGKS